MAQAPAGESERIERILNGERDLFHELIEPYERSAYMTAVSVVRDGAEAEDVVQEAMIKAYRGLAGFRGEAKFSTWLTSIVLNEARNRLRRTAKIRVESLDSSEHEEEFTPFLIADWREIPSDALEQAELAAQIESAIAGLPASYREAFLLRDKEEMSIEEIAQAVGVSPNLVKVRLFRARMMLQKRLAPYLKRDVPQPPRQGWLSWTGRKMSGKRMGGRP